MGYLKRARYWYLVVLTIGSFCLWILLSSDLSPTSTDINLSLEFPRWQSIQPVTSKLLSETRTSIARISNGTEETTILPHKSSDVFAHVWEDAVLLAGRIRPRPGLLTIGVPTTYRRETSYLRTTLTSVIDNMSDIERRKVVVVVFCTGHNITYANHVTRIIKSIFKQHIDTGFIRVVAASQNYYPPMNTLELTFNDSLERVKWRSRQNLDYAFLVGYSQNISKYYLQIEDDVLATPHFVGRILEFVNKQKINWAVLDFSGKGFIGKLFKSSDLLKLSLLLRVFFNEQPCDFLVNYFRGLLVQTKYIVRKPAVFKHIGYFSTLQNQIRNTGSELKRKTLNPSADVSTTIQKYKTFTIERAYAGESKFWGVTPRKGDVVTIKFTNVQNSIRRIVIQTGNNRIPPVDKLQAGVLEYGKYSKRGCEEYVRVARFIDGEVNYDCTGLRNIGCFRILITEDHPNWVIIRSIKITSKLLQRFVKDNSSPY